MSVPHRRGPAIAMGPPEFGSLFDSLRAWGRWGEQDERGALNLLTAERVAAAAALVRDGTTVSLGRLLDARPGPENPRPADHHMTLLTDVDIGSGSLRFAKDYIGSDYHNDTHSHLDALCHVAYEGKLFNGFAADAIGEHGSPACSVGVARDGIVGRGILLDVPAALGVPWLEPGENVFGEDLDAAMHRQGIESAVGDIVLIRVGHARRLAELGPWDTAAEKAGLHPTTMKLLAARDIAALGCDGNNDTAPSAVNGIGFPIHALALNAMGVHLFDYLDLERLAEACAAAHRWEFLFVASPLLIAGGTGSPLNPLAIL
jgi:kynurenine formamidase